MPAGSAAVSRAFAWLVLVAPTEHARLAFRRSAQDLLPQDLPPQDLPPIASPQMKTPTRPESRRANTQPRQPLQPSPMSSSQDWLACAARCASVLLAANFRNASDPPASCQNWLRPGTEVVKNAMAEFTSIVNLLRLEC